MKKYLYLLGIIISLIIVIFALNLRTSWHDFESIHRDRAYAVTCTNHGVQISWLRIEYISYRDNCQNI